MIKNLSYKQKLQFTGIAAVIGLILCYALAIHKTIAEHALYKNNRQESENLQAAGNSLQALHNKEERLNALFSRFQLDTLKADRNLLTVVSDYCKNNGIILKEYKPYSFFNKDSIQVLTRTVTIEGAFIPCLQLLNRLETSGKVGKASSADFKSYVDPQDKKTKLNCTLFVQNLIPNHPETD